MNKTRIDMPEIKDALYHLLWQYDDYASLRDAIRELYLEVERELAPDVE